MEFDAKKALKDAKEAVKNKDFQTALELCKNIIKNDKANYLGWVLSAVAFQETGQSDKALAAFSKATEINPNQLPGWQGLAAFLEQERNKTVLSTDNGEKSKLYTEKLVSAYNKIVELLHGDPAKQTAVMKKQFELYAATNQLEECIETAQFLMGKNDSEFSQTVVRVLSPLQPKLNDKGQKLFEAALLRAIPNANEAESVAIKQQYLQVLLHKNDYQKAVEVANEILQNDPGNDKSLKALCEIFVEDPTVEIPLDTMSMVIANSSSCIHDSYVINAARGCLLLKLGSLSEARQLLEAVNRKSQSKSTLRLLCEVYQKLHQWSQAEVICKTAQNLNLTDEETDQWSLWLLRSLLEQENAEKLQEAQVLIENYPSAKQNSVNFKLLKGFQYLREENIQSLGEILSSLEAETDFNRVQPDFVAVKSSFLVLTDRSDEALNLLKECTSEAPSNGELHLLLAKLFWKIGRREESVPHLLSVVKINRDLCEPYILMGNFYADQSDLASVRRAIRCLERAFQLEPQRVETVQRLLDLYHRTDDIPAAMTLLDVVIKSYSSTECRWAWIKKGRLHLEHQQGNTMSVLEKEKEATQAIGCFQNALRIDNGESSCWEFLGDAYVARGSYMAALKAFQKAAELNPDSLYSSYQTANIRQILGERREAIGIYENILSRFPDYVPALKGLAETYLHEAADLEARGFTGRLADNCANALKLLVKAARIKPQLSCLWSLMGHVCLMLDCIPESEFRFRVPALLLGSSPTSNVSDEVSISKKQLMDLGIKFYLAALKILPDSPALWYNLGLCYHYCSRLAGEQRSTYNQSAMAAIKKAITLEPSESVFWNLLGLVAEAPAVSQHCFIQALELNPKMASTWTNLGTLYYEYGDYHLAHKCFKQAQNIDPFYVPAWIGQSNVAEKLKPAEAMDLFRHTIAIGSGRPSECEGALPYAQWVLATLCDTQGREKAHYRYNIVQMHAIPTAVDGLNLYIALYPEDSCALNILGLLYERQGLLQRAEEVLVRGVAVLQERDCPVNQARLDKMKANLARIYTAMDRYDDATELYASLQESELSFACGIALAHFKAGRFEESYVTYEAALHWLASDDALRSHLLVAMAMAAFRRDLSDPEAAQTLLFQSCQLQPPSVYGLLSLAALGLLTEDDTLTDAAFQEMLAYQTEPRYVADISFLKAFRHWSSGKSQQASRELCRHIHMLPHIPQLWFQLASFQAAAATQDTQSGSSSRRPVDGLLVARCAEMASESLRQHDTSTVDQQVTDLDQSKVMSLTAIGYLMAGRRKESLIAAQKAVHFNPHSAATWSVLLATAVSSWTSSKASQSQLVWLKQLIGHLRRRCDVAAFSGLAPWLGGYERRLTSLLSQN